MVDKDFLTDFEEQKAINEIIEKGFTGRKKAMTWQKQLVAAVAIIIIGIPTFGFSFPALAQHIPLIGGLFAQMDSAGMGGNLDMITEYATTVDETQVADGVSITLVEQFFDGHGIYLSYLVESEFALNRGLEWFEYALTREVTVMIDGEALLVDDGGWVPYIFWVDDYSFFFMLNIPLFEAWEPTSEVIANATEIDVTLTILEFGINSWNYADDILEVDAIATGPWEFRLSIEQSELTRIPVYEWMDNEIVDYGILSLYVTPNRFIINYGSWANYDQLIFESVQATLDLNELWRWLIDDVESLDSIFTIQWQVVDNNGVELALLQHNQDYIWFSASGSIHLINDGLDRNQLIVTPVAYEWAVTTEYGKLLTGELLNRTELESVVIDLPY